ncbi:hypothetical protein SESBI_40895 [Sesbania bispinosa]|nr:hypothetical protein SESBI_40895 [Sesbania bispinosa]
MESTPVNWEALDVVIRRSLETGAIDAVVDLLRIHAPSILNDHRILFRLHKQVSLSLSRRWRDGEAGTRDADSLETKMNEGESPQRGGPVDRSSGARRTRGGGDDE